MKSVEELPFRNLEYYFENEINKDLNKFYDKFFIYDYDVISIDKTNHIVEYRNEYSEIDGTDFISETFENSISEKLKTYISESINLIEIGYSKRYLDKNEVKAYTDFLKKNISRIESLEAFNKFPFIKKYTSKITDIINHYSIEIKSNHFNYSYVILPEDKSEQILDKLFELLTKSPAIINCSKDEFYNAFTGKELTEGISWLITGSNKAISKPSIFYFIEQLVENKYLGNNIYSNFNKHIEYVFRDNNGNTLKNIKQSRSLTSKNPSYKVIIDEIISSL